MTFLPLLVRIPSRLPVSRFGPRLALIRTPPTSRNIVSTPIRRNAAPPHENPGPNHSGPHPLALLAVASVGFAAYYILVKNREKQTVNDTKELPVTRKDARSDLTSAFSPDEVTVIFVLGGPGAGKGTQCANLVKDYEFVHLSAGDLLREEQNRPGSQYGDMIKTFIKEGKIVPMEVTIALLENAMKAAIEKSGKRRFLIDGFPRKMDQALKFEEIVVPSQFVLYFECPENVLLERLLKRGETSGRADDNIETIKKRFATFIDSSFPVVEHYQKKNRVHTVSCQNTPENVYGQVKLIFNDLFQENK